MSSRAQIYYIASFFFVFFGHNIIFADTSKNHEEHHATEHAPAAQKHAISDVEPLQEEAQEAPQQKSGARKVNRIIISGNKYISDEAILHRIPYRPGQIFDPQKTRTLIRNLYYDLNRFRNITVMGENVGTGLINIHVTVQEKTPITGLEFTGNKHLDAKEIKKKTNIDEVPALDEEELKKYVLAIKKLYEEKSYLDVAIQTELQKDTEGKAVAAFTVDEGKRSIVKRVKFVGNHNIPSKTLRNIIFTREDWILGFMDQAGTYHPERLELGDKQIIEQFYQNNGYLNAKVIDIAIDRDPGTQNITVIFEIEEGDLYTIKEVKAPGNDVLTEEQLLSFLPVAPGMIFSRQAIVTAIKFLEQAWSNRGYIYAHVTPSIEPNDDDKTVSLAFYSELGDKVFLRRINIKGNKKTRDKIIRRKLVVQEGELLTNNALEASKTRVESLGYFDQQQGVNWKTTRISKDTADLDLLLNETKTGNAHLKIGFGGAPSNSSGFGDKLKGVSVEGSISDANLRGSGISFNLTGRASVDEQSFQFNLTDPWLFDKPIYGAFDVYHKRIGYDELNHCSAVNERHTGGTLTTGFVTDARSAFLSDTFIRIALGIENTQYGERGPKVAVRGLRTAADIECANTQYQIVLNKLFQKGDFVSLSLHVGQDKKNHPIHPNHGHTWVAQAFFAIPSISGNLGFYKFDIDANWYTPIIGDYDLVFHVRGYMGIVGRIQNKFIPYRELFHIGGADTVRGFLFGQIGPQFNVTVDKECISDSIGARKGAFISAELIFPIKPDFSMKGLVFYDGGAGWDNPYACDLSPRFLKNNSFNYRHSVGVGIRMLNPMPIRIDWGFKLDARKGESAHEVHFGMSYDW